jgi:hypothetical protein
LQDISDTDRQAFCKASLKGFPCVEKEKLVPDGKPALVKKIGNLLGTLKEIDMVDYPIRLMTWFWMVRTA